MPILFILPVAVAPQAPPTLWFWEGKRLRRGKQEGRAYFSVGKRSVIIHMDSEPEWNAIGSILKLIWGIIVRTLPGKSWNRKVEPVLKLWRHTGHCRNLVKDLKCYILTSVTVCLPVDGCQLPIWSVLLSLCLLALCQCDSWNLSGQVRGF